MAAGGGDRSRGGRRPERSDAGGFYEPALAPQEQQALEALPQGSLESEIMMLRVLIRRTLALSAGVQELDAGVKLLSAMSLAATRLARLLKAQQELGGEDNQVMDAFAQAMRDVMAEFRLGGDER